jgi:hypothetical protein
VTVRTGSNKRLVRRSLFPPRPIAPLSSLLGVELLAAELAHKLLGMFGVGEAVDVPPLVIAEDRVTALAEGQVLAEHVNDVVAAIERHRGRQRDLVRPPAIYAGRGKLAFAVHHAEGENEYGTASIFARYGGCASGTPTSYCYGHRDRRLKSRACSAVVLKNESRGVAIGDRSRVKRK